ARIEHDTARSDAEYAAKLDRYAALWARQRRAAGRRAGPLAAPLHAAAHWLKNFVLRGGFLDGGSAPRYHFLHARYVYRKYDLLRRVYERRWRGARGSRQGREPFPGRAARGAAPAGAALAASLSQVAAAAPLLQAAFGGGGG